jgi:hypothetical protein
MILRRASRQFRSFKAEFHSNALIRPVLSISEYVLIDWWAPGR